MSKKVLVVGGGPVGAFSAYFLKKMDMDVKWISGKSMQNAAAWSSAGLLGVGLSFPLPEYEGLRGNIKWLLKRDSPVKLGMGFLFSNAGWFLNYSRSRDKIISKEGINAQTFLTVRTLDSMNEFFQSKVIDADYSKKGLLQLFSDQHFMEEHLKQLKNTEGQIGKYEVLDSQACKDMEPSIKKNNIMGIFYPEEYSLNPQKLLMSLRKLNEEEGVETIENDIVSLESSGNKVTGTVLDNEERIVSSSYLLAAGSKNQHLSRSLNLHVPVVPGWGHAEVLSSNGLKMKVPVELAEKGVYIIPTSEILKITSFFEFRGENFKAPQNRFQFIENAVAEYFPHLKHLNPSQKTSGKRPCTPDSLPIVGKSGKFENLFFATGNCRQGIMQSAEMGKVASNVILNGKLPEEYSMLSPSRFGI
jgi:D-amino-acid dehydrogenase